MNQVQSIMSLMKHDLNASQLAKLQSVLEAVLSVQKDRNISFQDGVNGLLI